VVVLLNLDARSLLARVERNGAPAFAGIPVLVDSGARVALGAGAIDKAVASGSEKKAVISCGT